jgi:hypothetical protein
LNRHEKRSAYGEIESHHPGYLDSQDAFYVGTIKGAGRIYQQIFVDTYSKWAADKLHITKTPITGADLLNDRILPFLSSNEFPAFAFRERVLYCRKEKADRLDDG